MFRGLICNDFFHHFQWVKSFTIPLSGSVSLKNKSDQVVNTRVLRSPSNLLTIKLLRKRTWIFRPFSGRKQADMTLFNRWFESFHHVICSISACLLHQNAMRNDAYCTTKPKRTGNNYDEMGKKRLRKRSLFSKRSTFNERFFSQFLLQYHA